MNRLAKLARQSPNLATFVQGIQKFPHWYLNSPSLKMWTKLDCERFYMSVKGNNMRTVLLLSLALASFSFIGCSSSKKIIEGQGNYIVETAPDGSQIIIELVTCKEGEGVVYLPESKQQKRCSQ